MPGTPIGLPPTAAWVRAEWALAVSVAAAWEVAARVAAAWVAAAWVAWAACCAQLLRAVVAHVRTGEVGHTGLTLNDDAVVTDGVILRTGASLHRSTALA